MKDILSNNLKQMKTSQKYKKLSEHSQELVATITRTSKNTKDKLVL